MAEGIRIKRVMMENGADSYPLTKRILAKLNGTPVEEMEDEHLIRYCDPFEPGKDVLELMVYKGSFLKPCPGTKEYICCKYQILNIATNCPLDCSYCILQAYFNQPHLRVFVNIEEGLKSVLKIIDENPDEIFRVGTGEFTDSLALDPIVGWAEMLIPQFSKRKNAILELKTKTDHIKGAISSPYRDRIVLSWSLNSSFISSREEHGAVSIKKRLEAARICQSEGFVIGFHFDPMIIHDNWQEGYLETIELMDRYIDPSRIIWISLGSFRYMPSLKDIIIRRHKTSRVLSGEFIKGLDGKMRYFKPLRIELYSYMFEKLNEWHPDLGIYLCMESDDVWKSSFGWSPGSSDGLKKYLDERVVRFYGR